MTSPVMPAPLFLAGATASGKSELALELAAALDGEIISVDSMQVYRGLDIGTAKPSPAERTRVPHHLIDVVEVGERFDAAQFVARARAAETAIRARGRRPIYCGGTGLYFQALLGGLGDAPPTNPALRAELERTPRDELLGELAARDPETFGRIDRHNRRRVVRALEVIRLTGRPFSAQRAAWDEIPALPGVPHFFILDRAKPDLDARINARVDAMFAAGLVAETRAMLQCGLATNPTALQAIGYRQVVEHLSGERPLAETIELVKIRTRQFAKRQLTWWRRYAPPGARWLALAAGHSAAELAPRLVDEIASAPA